jgi:hypothetical protein
MLLPVVLLLFVTGRPVPVALEAFQTESACVRALASWIPYQGIVVKELTGKPYKTWRLECVVRT